MKTRNHARRNGISLVEVSLSTFMVGTLLVTALSASSFKARHQAALNTEALRVRLVERLLAETVALGFQDASGSTVIGVETGESSADRNTWDDVDDAHGYTASPPRARDNSTRAGLTGWQESIVVEYVRPTTLIASLVPQPLKKITVVVASPDGQTTSLTAIVADTHSHDPRSGVSTSTGAMELNSSDFRDSLGPSMLLRNKP